MTQKDNVDTKRHAVEGQVEVRDYVLLRNTKTNKLSPNYDCSPCEVIDRNKEEVKLRKKNGVEIKRCVTFEVPREWYFRIRIRISGTTSTNC